MASSHVERLHLSTLLTAECPMWQQLRSILLSSFIMLISQPVGLLSQLVCYCTGWGFELLGDSWSNALSESVKLSVALCATLRTQAQLCSSTVLP